MEWLDEAHLGWHRIEAIIRRDRVAHALGWSTQELREETEAWLAFLGWTETSFLTEAYPELYGGTRG
jgi:hypothetical protein